MTYRLSVLQSLQTMHLNESIYWDCVAMMCTKQSPGEVAWELHRLSGGAISYSALQQLLARQTDAARYCVERSAKHAAKADTVGKLLFEERCKDGQ